MKRLSSTDVDAIRAAARALKAKMDELYGEDLEDLREQQTRILVKNLFERAEKGYLEQEGPLPEHEFDAMRAELKRVVSEVVAEEFGVVVNL